MRLGTFFLKLHFFLKHENEKNIYLQKIIRQATWFFVNTQVKDRIKDPEDFWPIDIKKSDVEINAEAFQESLNKLIELSKKVWQSR